jgi:hypothetical protein
MTREKRTIHLTDDNWVYYLPDRYPALLVCGLTVLPGGIDRDALIVTKLPGWPARAAGRRTFATK